ncbi:uncharacterized protein LOC144716221 [Wolffia australiana]
MRCSAEFGLSLQNSVDHSIDRSVRGGAMSNMKRREEAAREDAQSAGPSSVSCSICLENLSPSSGPRSVATLLCGHEFHLDCIGSAFNAGGIMKCPNCRRVENGRWLYSNGCRSSHQILEESALEDVYHSLGHADSLFRYYWCPVRGFAQLASLIEGVGPQETGHADQPGHMCPYLALVLHGRHAPPPPPVLAAQPTAATESFHHYPVDIARQPSFAAVTQGFAEPVRHSWTAAPGGDHQPSGSMRGGGFARPASFGRHPLSPFLQHHYHHQRQQQHQLHLWATGLEPQPVNWGGRVVECSGLPWWGLFRHGGANNSLFHHHHPDAAEILHGEGAHMPIPLPHSPFS